MSDGASVFHRKLIAVSLIPGFSLRFLSLYGQAVLL